MASFGVGLAGTIFGLPIVASILIVALYLLPWPDHFVVPPGPGLALIAGSLLSIPLWLIGAWAMRHHATSRNADAREYGAIYEELCELDAQLAAVLRDSRHAQSRHASGSADEADRPAHDAFREAARLGARRLRIAIGIALRRPGLGWSSGVACNSTWRLIHRLEEAMIDLAPVEAVVRGALYDEARLQGSSIANRDGLLVKLRTALLQLRPSAAIYLDRQPPALVFPNGAAAPPSSAGSGAASGAATAETAHPFATGTAGTPPGDANGGANGGAGGGANGGANGGGGVGANTAARYAHLDRAVERQARSALRDVRRVINDFRDDQWDGLVLLRSQTVATLGYTSLLVLGMFALAIARGAPPEVIKAAAAFYLVGAVVGLFNRLSIESGQDHAVDDHGLSVVRLLLAPMLSGMAAVGGVVVTVMLYSTLLGSIGGPSNAVSGSTSGTAARSATISSATGPSAAQAGGPADGTAQVIVATNVTNAQHVARLSDIFNLETYPYGLLVAAVFGLTPGLLLAGLQQQSDQYQARLKNSQATESR